jgi:hypothetical protein
MLNSFNKIQKDFNEKISVTNYVTKKNTKTQTNSEINEHKNTIYYPFASTE